MWGGAALGSCVGWEELPDSGSLEAASGPVWCPLPAHPPRLRKGSEKGP